MSDSDFAFVGRCEHDQVVAAITASGVAHNPKVMASWTTKKGGNLKVEQTTVGEARKGLQAADCPCIGGAK